MKTADKYIVRGFMISFLWSLFALLVIYIIVDVFEQISTYVDNEVPVLVIIQYYIYQIPYLIGTLISPIACLLGCTISIGNLSRHMELMSLRAAGISPQRLLLPLIIVGFIISGLIFGVNEFLAPPVNQKYLTLKETKIKKCGSPRYGPAQNLYYSGENNKFYHIKFIDPSKGVIEGLTIYEFLKGKEVIKKRIDAPRAKYEGEALLHSKFNWKVFNGSQYVFDHETQKVIYFDSLFLRLKETPYDFVKGIKDELAMGFYEFKTYIKNLQKKGEDITKQLVDYYLRISFPFMNLIVILIGFPLASKIRNLGFIVGFAISLFVSFLYWGFSQLARAYGHTGILTPWLASFLPNIIFIIVGAGLLYKFRK